MKLGDRLAVGLRTLTPLTQVRILVPQPWASTKQSHIINKNPHDKLGVCKNNQVLDRCPRRVRGGI